MTAVDNSPLLHVNQPPVNTIGFVPGISYTCIGDGNITLTSDVITYPATDSLKHINYKVHDTKGGTAYGERASAIASADTEIDISDLDTSEGVTVCATIVTTKGCISDGSAKVTNLTDSTGTLANWTSGQFSTALG